MLNICLLETQPDIPWSQVKPGYLCTTNLPGYTLVHEDRLNLDICLLRTYLVKSVYFTHLDTPRSQVKAVHLTHLDISWNQVKAGYLFSTNLPGYTQEPG